MSRRLLVVPAVLLVYVWVLHTLVLAGTVLLDQHPVALLRTSPAESHQHPVDGARQAIIVAEQVMRPGASVAIVYGYREQPNHFNQTYVYYWATYRMYPRPIVIANSPREAASGAPDYILVIGDPPLPTAPQPEGYRTLQANRFYDGTTLTVLVRA